MIRVDLWHEPQKDENWKIILQVRVCVAGWARTCDRGWWKGRERGNWGCTDWEWWEEREEDRVF